MQKIGYFKIEWNGKTDYLSYDEYYARGEEFKKSLKRQQDNGKIRMSCACQDTENLELTITKNLIIRVKNNGQQMKHKESCPKSEVYNRWLEEHQAGAFMSEDGKLCFNVIVPTGIKTENNYSGSSESSSGSTYKKRADGVDLAKSVNALAWQKQTWSIKKQIGESRKKGEKPNWSYKTKEEFIRLFYGVTNDVDIFRNHETLSLAAMCYKASTFYEADYKQKFFLYAKVDKLGEYNEERKYQYITVFAASNKSNRKATVRVSTEEYDRMFKDIVVTEQDECVLAGYVRHDSFKTDEGINHWITLLKGGIIFTSDNGLYLNSKDTEEKNLIDALSKKRILFKKPVLPLESYGDNIPSLIIEQLKGKDIIIDICTTSQEKGKKQKLAKENPEYDVMLYGKKDSVEQIMTDLFEKFEQKKNQYHE